MKIYNIIINDSVVYVGKTKDIEQRKRQHKYLLVHNKHQNKYLQTMYNVHKNFTITEVISNATERDEQLEINKHNTKQRMNRATPSINELRSLHKQVFDK